MGAGRRQLTNLDAAELFEDVDVTSHVETTEQTADELSPSFGRPRFTSRSTRPTDARSKTTIGN